MYFYTALFLSAVGRELLPCNLISERQVENRKTHHHTQLYMYVFVCLPQQRQLATHATHSLDTLPVCLRQRGRHFWCSFAAFLLLPFSIHFVSPSIPFLPLGNGNG